MNPTLQQPLGLARTCWVASILILGLMCLFQALNFLDYADMDFRIYYDASMALRNGEDMFAPWNPDSPLTYIYPPLLAILFIPLTLLPLETAAATWTIISMLLLAGCLSLGAREVIRRFDGAQDVATLPVIILVAILLSLPRIKAEIDQGQVDYLVLIGIIGSLALLKRHPFLAGMLLGLVANVKYQTAIFIPLIIIRGWWSALLGFVAGSVGIALSGALVIGWDVNLGYLAESFTSLVLLFGGSPADDSGPMVFPLEWIDSVSLSSTFARWSIDLGWGTRGTYLMIGTASVLCLALGWITYFMNGVPLFRGRSGHRGRTDDLFQGLIALEWVGLLVALMAFAPQTKMRHMALLVLMMLFVAQFLVVRRGAVGRVPLLVATILFFLGMVLPLATDSETFTYGPREIWRGNGGVIITVLVLFFVMLWNGCGWVRVTSSAMPVAKNSLQDPD